MSTTFNHELALKYPWPLAPGWSEEFNRIITIALASDRKRHCFICGAEIAVGQTARVRFEIRREPAPAQHRLFYGCARCCVAMAKAEEDGGRAVEERKAKAERRRVA